jgi:hypothetical protein
MPGMVDAHTHAPQYVFTGTGSDLPLLDWLNKYTFPTEAKFSDVAFAADAYGKGVVSLVCEPLTAAAAPAERHDHRVLLRVHPCCGNACPCRHHWCRIIALALALSFSLALAFDLLLPCQRGWASGHLWARYAWTATRRHTTSRARRTRSQTPKSTYMAVSSCRVFFLERSLLIGGALL